VKPARAGGVGTSHLLSINAVRRAGIGSRCSERKPGAAGLPSGPPLGLARIPVWSRPGDQFRLRPSPREGGCSSEGRWTTFGRRDAGRCSPGPWICWGQTHGQYRTGRQCRAQDHRHGVPSCTGGVQFLLVINIYVPPRRARKSAWPSWKTDIRERICGRGIPWNRIVHR